MDDNRKIKKVLQMIGITIFIFLIYKVYKEVIASNVLKSVVEIESGMKDVGIVCRKSVMLITKKDNADEKVIKRMAVLGWEYVATFGRGYVFGNGNEEILLTKRNYVGGYCLFSLDPNEKAREFLTR
jgi:hypothetical protein